MRIGLLSLGSVAIAVLFVVQPTQATKSVDHAILRAQAVVTIDAIQNQIREAVGSVPSVQEPQDVSQIPPPTQKATDQGISAEGH